MKRQAVSKQTAAQSLLKTLAPAYGSLKPAEPEQRKPQSLARLLFVSSWTMYVMHACSRALTEFPRQITCKGESCSYSCTTVLLHSL